MWHWNWRSAPEVIDASKCYRGWSIASSNNKVCPEKPACIPQWQIIKNASQNISLRLFVLIAPIRPKKGSRLNTFKRRLSFRRKTTEYTKYIYINIYFVLIMTCFFKWQSPAALGELRLLSVSKQKKKILGGKGLPWWSNLINKEKRSWWFCPFFNKAFCLLLISFQQSILLCFNPISV